MQHLVGEMSGDSLQQVEVHVTAYGAGEIRIIFRKEVTPSVYRVFNNLSAKISLIGSNKILLVSDAGEIHHLYGILNKQFTLSNEDKQFFVELFNRVDPVIQQRFNLKNTSNEAQEKSLTDLASPFIDAIIESTGNCQLIALMIRASFYNRPNDVGQTIEEILSKETIDIAVLEPCNHLRRICHGAANMEGHFLRLDSVTLPSLTTQRIYLRNFCLTKLKSKFSSLADSEQLILYLGIINFCSEGQRGSPLDDEKLRKAILFALQEPQQLMPIIKSSDVFHAFRPMGISLAGDFSVNNPNLNRIIALREKLASPLLGEILQHYAIGKAWGRKMQENSLYHALEAKDIGLVKEALEAGADVNQYFSDGRTPLLYALQTNDVGIVEVILSHNPDVNKKNSHGFFNPIMSALKCGDVAILGKLLQKGANPFSHCGSISTTVPSYPPKQVHKFVAPIAVAIDEYNNDKSEANLNLVKKLLEFGAGIGTEFCPEISNHLDGMVVFGSKFKPISGVHPIFNAIMFQEVTDRKYFQRWKRIFEQAQAVFSLSLANIPFADGLELLRILQQVIDFIDVCFVSSNTQTAATDSGSSLYPADHKYIKLVRDAAEILAKFPKKDLFMESLRSRNYGQALRRACTAKEGIALSLVKLLIKFRCDDFSKDVNQPAGDNQYTALHHAAAKGHQQVYDLLIQNNADNSIVGKDEKTPAGIAEDKFAAASCRVAAF